MFRREAQRATAAADGRDDALAQRALDLACRGPLMITGLAGIGKSWFLRRLAALALRRRSSASSVIDAVEPYDALADGAAPVARALLGRLQAPEPRRLVVVDGLSALALCPERERLFEAIARFSGPLVMAAPPALLPHAALGRCRSLVLPPLSVPERRALLQKVLGPGDALDAERAAVGLDPAWGGHPRVVAEVGALLAERLTARLIARAVAPLAVLMEIVTGRLPGHGAAIVASLAKDEQEALFAVARGEGVPGRLRGAALSLTLHGALVRKGDGWVVESQVLARQLW